MTSNSLVSQQENDIIDVAEVMLLENDEFEPIEFPLKHVFIPGFYCRQIFMPAGSRLTSQIHKTRHPYVISQGKLVIYNKGECVELEAPVTGITNPGTRRILYIKEDTIFTTFHPFSTITGEENSYSKEEKKKLVDDLEELLIEKRINPLIGMSYAELKEEQKKLSHV
jgi:hypothetical protein